MIVYLYCKASLLSQKIAQFVLVLRIQNLEEQTEIHLISLQRNICKFAKILNVKAIIKTKMN